MTDPIQVFFSQATFDSTKYSFTKLLLIQSKYSCTSHS